MRSCASRNVLRHVSTLCALVIVLLLPAASVAAGPGGDANSYVRPRPWSARWIQHPTAEPTAYGVYHFRKHLTLTAPPEHFRVKVSADNRYRLFVNGAAVATGPARSDLLHWRYETVDLAPQLRAGDNVVAAVVWNFGPGRQMAQMSLMSGFIVQAVDPAAEVLDTDETWKVTADEAYAPLPVDGAKLHTYIVVGPGVRVDGAKYPWGWEQPGFDDRGWPSARPLGHGEEHGVGTEVTWWLAPRTIPQPEETPQRLARVRRATGATVTDAFLAGHGAFTVAPHRQTVVLLDQGFETNAYPHLRVGGGRGSVVTVTYAEALVDERGEKGDRNEIEGRHISGFADEFRPDGGAPRDFETLWYRTFRYVELAIETGDEPLTVEDFSGVFTGYPFREEGRFASDDPQLGQLWTVGWRTARLCAFETYMDCPYYEQLQYTGDTRIQALISLYVSGDDRLMRNAIEQYDQSRIAEGLTLSRYPSRLPQVINTFSLFWIDMVHDYWMHRDDAPFVARRLTGTALVLDWFARHVEPQTGMLGGLPYWSFVDWPDGWKGTPDNPVGGEPPGAGTGGSAALTLQYAGTLRRAADLFAAFGREAEAAAYREQARRLCEATMRLCWDPQRELVADTPARHDFSQHTNVLAVLAGAMPEAQARDVIARTARDTSIVQCTQYFRFYLLRAMKAAGWGDSYVEMLQPWREMLARGLTTFAERPDPTRSDCHAWSASPNYELLATVCGIEPGSPGFKTVRIEPHLGPLHHVEGVVPHPGGRIEVVLDRDGAGVQGSIALPPGVTGEFIWAGRRTLLHEGKQTVHD